MYRLDLSYFYKTGEVIHPLTLWAGEKTRGQILVEGYSAHQHIEGMIASASLKSSYADAIRLKDLLAPHVSITDLDIKIEAWTIGAIAQQAQKFETVLNAEIAIAQAYVITPPGGYNLDVLMYVPQSMFPNGLTTLVPECVYDIGEAAKCLAFEVPTAAAFHLHRINEAVIHHYWDAVTNGSKKPKNRNLGAYLSAMRQKEVGDQKVLAVLEQIKDLHRNPVIHPEEVLSPQDAITLAGIIVSAVSTMLVTIKDYKAKQEFSVVRLVEKDL